MSLLQKASIITTPTAYAEDYLYSIKPAYALGSELVTNGTFDTDSNWTKGSAWSIANGKATYDDTSNSGLSQSISFTSSKSYKITFEILSGSGSIAFLSSNGVTTYVTYATYSVGLHTVNFKYTTGTGFSVFASTFLGGAFTIDNVSVREVTDADFDFDRNSTGTRVNEDYLIEDVPYNISTYSEDFNSWAQRQNVTLTENATLSPIGTGNATKVLATSTSAKVRNNFTCQNGVTYTFSIFCKNIDATTMTLLIYDGSASHSVDKISEVSTDAWNRISISFTATQNSTSGQIQFARDLPNGESAFFWGAQLVKGDQPKDYLKTTDRLDIPRIDYTNGEPSILLEPSRTNDILNNTNLSQWLIGAGITVTSNAVNSPEGIQNADKIEKTSENYTFVRQGLGIGSVSVFSIFVKQGNYRYIGIRNNDLGHSVFDFETKSFVTSLSDHNLSIQQFPNGWFRLIDERTISTNTSIFRGVALTLSNGTEFHQDIPLNAFAYVWGGQLENNQTYATSLIHTSGSAVTRSADAANNAGNSDLINSTEGVLYAELKTSFEGTSGVQAISLQDSSNNYISIYFRDNNNFSARISASGGATQIDSKYVTEQFYKVALSYNSSNTKLFIDGRQIGNTTTTALVSGLNELAFDRGSGFGTEYEGNAKMVAVFKEALTDLELEKLTGYNNHELYMNYYNRLSYLGLVEEYNVESDINNYIL